MVTSARSSTSWNRADLAIQWVEPLRITAAAPSVTREAKSNDCHVFGLQTLRPLLNLKGHACALVERFVTVGRNGGKMHEHIFATFALDKPKSLSGVEPLYSSSFCQDDSFCDLTLTYRLRVAPLRESVTRKPVQRTSKDLQDDNASQSSRRAGQRSTRCVLTLIQDVQGSTIRRLPTSPVAPGSVSAGGWPSQADFPAPESSGSSPRVEASGVSPAYRSPGPGEPLP